MGSTKLNYGADECFQSCLKRVFFCLATVTISCLVMQQRYGRRYQALGGSDVVEDGSGAGVAYGRSHSIASATSIRDIEDATSTIVGSTSPYCPDLDAIDEDVADLNDLEDLFGSVADDHQDGQLFSPNSEFCSIEPTAATSSVSAATYATSSAPCGASSTSAASAASACNVRQRAQCAHLLRRYRARSRSLHQLTEPEGTPLFPFRR